MNRTHSLKKQTILLSFILISLLLIFGCDNQSTGYGNTDKDPSSDGNVCTEKVSLDKTSDAKLYYPCNISTPVAASTMSGGSGCTWKAVEWLSMEMAAAGYVVLAFTPLNKHSGLVPRWTDGHLSAIDKLKQFNNGHNVLRNKIRTEAIQVAGHSKGGGGALQAAIERRGEVASVIGMAPYARLLGTGEEEYPINELSNVRAPVLIQCGGSRDISTPPAATREQFDALPNHIPKAYHRFTKYGHMVWCSNGDADKHARLARDIIAWMKYYLDDDRFRADDIQDPSEKSVNIWEK